jgi:general stress protein YciG
MAGTKAGGQKAAAKNLAKDPNFYAKIGAKGGANGKTGGFASYTECVCPIVSMPHHKAQCAGKKGGAVSRKRGKKFDVTVVTTPKGRFVYS